MSVDHLVCLLLLMSFDRSPTLTQNIAEIPTNHSMGARAVRRLDAGASRGIEAHPRFLPTDQLQGPTHSPTFRAGSSAYLLTGPSRRTALFLFSLLLLFNFS